MSFFERHRILAAMLTLGAGLFVAYWAAELLDGRVPWKRGTIGFVALGAVLAGLDIVWRARAMREYGAWSFVHPGVAMSARVVPFWILGLGLVVAGLLLTSH